MNLLLLGRSGASPLHGVVSKRKPDVSLDDIFSYIDDHPKIKTVVLGAFWGNYFNEDGVMVEKRPYKNIIEDPGAPAGKNQSEIFQLGLQRTLAKLERSGKRVIILLNITPMVSDYADCLSRPFGRGSSECGFLLSTNPGAHAYRKEMMNVLAGYPKVQVIDPVPALCPNGMCPFVDGGIVMYSDAFHLSEAGARLLWRRIGVRLH